jgi:hypothetical protein
VKKDIAAAGIALVDADNRVVDLHAMRHTFSTEVARQEPNQKKAQRLTRHESAAVFSKYVHLALGEMSDALDRVTYSAVPGAILATGTDGPPVVQTGCISGHFPAQAVTVRVLASGRGDSANRSEKQGETAFRLNECGSADRVAKMRPSTQVGFRESSEFPTKTSIPETRGPSVVHGDPDLTQIIASWPHLPATIRAAVLAVVRSSGKGDQ